MTVFLFAMCGVLVQESASPSQFCGATRSACLQAFFLLSEHLIKGQLADCWSCPSDTGDLGGKGSQDGHRGAEGTPWRWSGLFYGSLALGVNLNPDS